MSHYSTNRNVTLCILLGMNERNYTMREVNTISCMERIKEGIMTRKEAASRLGMSYRQILRIYQRYYAEGAQGIVHKGRGKKSNYHGNAELHRTVCALYREQYQGFGITLASELMKQKHSIDVRVETLHWWLTAEGLWKAKQNTARHRLRRERRAQFGQMERSHRVYQDRLVKMLGMHNMSTIEEANWYLDHTFVSQINEPPRVSRRHNCVRGLCYGKQKQICPRG